MIKYLIVGHLIGWFATETLEGYQAAKDWAEKQKSIPGGVERLASSVENFFWEFTLIPSLIGSVIAAYVIAGKSKDK